MAKKTHSSPQPSSLTSLPHKTTPDPTPTPTLPSKPSSQSHPLHIQPLSTIPPPLSPSNRPNRSKKPTPLAAAAAAAAESSKRVCFTVDDVLLILKFLVDFKSKTGKDPVKHVADFQDSLKSALVIEITGRQLQKKIRSLRIKFEKQCESTHFSSPFDEEVFELSKKVWGLDCQVVEKETSPQKDNAAEKLMLEESPEEENDVAMKPLKSMKLMLEAPPVKENAAAKKPSTSMKPILLEEPPEKENAAAKKPSKSKKPMLEESPAKENAAKKPSTSKKKRMLEESPEKGNAAAKNLLPLKIPMLEEPPKKNNAAAKKPSTSMKLLLEEPPKKKNATAKKPSTSKKQITEEVSAVVDKEPAKGGSSDKVGDYSLSEMFRFDEMCTDKRYPDASVLKRGMELIGESEREELETRWKKLKVQEAELFLQRAELAEDQSRLVLKELQGLS